MESQNMKWLAAGHGSIILFTYRLQQAEQRYPHVAGINSHHPHFTDEKGWGSEEGCNDQNLFWTEAGHMVHECVSLSQSRDQLPWLRCWPASYSEWTQLSNRRSPTHSTSPWPLRNQATQQEVSSGWKLNNPFLPTGSGKIVFHESGPRGQKAWGPLI